MTKNIHHDMTICMVARNAEKTIKESILSAFANNVAKILIIDDQSSDDTLKIVRDCNFHNCTIEKIPTRVSLGHLRQYAINQIQTKYGMWLDSDDILPAHAAETYLQIFAEQECDLIYPNFTINDIANQSISAFKIADFIKQPHGIYFEFERHWQPTAICHGFNTEFARKYPFSPYSLSGEDYFFKLQAILNHAKISYCDDFLYEYRNQPGSISSKFPLIKRNLTHNYRLLPFDKVKNTLSQSMIPKPMQLWILSSFKQFCGYFHESNEILHELSKIPDIDKLVHQGYQRDLFYLSHFAMGVNYLNLGLPILANEKLNMILTNEIDAALYNNYAIAKQWQGNDILAQHFWHLAIQSKPQYQDCQNNISDKFADNITMLPFRSNYTIQRT